MPKPKLDVVDTGSIHSFKLHLRNTREGFQHTPRMFEGTEVEAQALAGDLWNRHAAHMPDRGWALFMYKDGETASSYTIR